MTLEEFLAITSKRLPTAPELMAVCEELGIGFGQTAEGKPVLKYGGDAKEEAIALVAMLRREPWRTQVMEAKGLIAKPAGPPCRVFLWRTGLTYRQPPEEEGQWPSGAWWWRVEGETDWQLVPGREEYARGHTPPEVRSA